MRLTLILLIAPIVCLAQTPLEKSAIAGRVVSAASGAPLKKASVWLEAFSPTRGVNGAPSVALPATTTDAEGRFTLDGVDPGSYLLLAQRIGYLDQGYGAPAPQLIGPPLDLGAGQTMTGITLKLTPQSLLYGKVLDEDGDPLPNAQVQVLRVSYAGGRRHLVEAGASGSQDDGSFVIGNLTPGRYYLSAGFRVVDEAGPPVRKAEREKYVTTYFPNTPDAGAATPVEVNPGAEVRGLAIRLHKARVYHIRGRVVLAESGGAGGHLSLQLAPKGEGGAPRSSVGGWAGADGRFEFGPILPGSYVVETNPGVTFVGINGDGQPATPNPGWIGRANISVTDGDVEDLVVPVGPGATITGRVQGAKTGQLLLTPADGNGSHSVLAEIKPDGSFRAEHILPDVYGLEVGGLGNGAFVKAVNFAGRPVEDWKIDLSSGTGGVLQLEVSLDAGEVSGIVRNGKGEPVPGATVQIWPAVGEGARSMKSDAHGEFRMSSLPPAEYRVAAWQDLDDDLAQYAPFRARFDADAAKVKVAEKSRERVELQLIGRDAVAAEAARLK